VTRRLPTSLDGVHGLRAARWIRESTAGQYDNFGPDAQRDQQDRAIARYELLDTGLSWSVASSGWKAAWTTPAFAAMLESARAGHFDVLVVGYVSRFLRNLKQTLIAVEDHLHPAGVAVLFVDERLLSSDPDDWGTFVREAQDAEAYSRKLSKRVGEGYAGKRRRLGIPGGNRAPYGLVREGHPSVLRVDPDKAAVVRQAYELAAAGWTDLEVAAGTGLAKTHVSEILTNPIYAGTLRTGEPAGVEAIVAPSLYTAVQTARERRRTRRPGRIVKRHYALRLRCAGCGRYLHGDLGRYRHPAPICDTFLAAKPFLPRTRGRHSDSRCQGKSYPQTWYEDAVGAILGEIGRIDDAAIAEVVRLHAEHEPKADQVALARIQRAREDAARAFARTKDLGVFQAAIAKLEVEEQIAAEPVDTRRLTPAEIVAYARSLPTLWADAGPDGRQALATALFGELSVLGYQQLEYSLSEGAIDLGLDAALPPVIDLGSKIAGFGRGERARASDNPTLWCVVRRLSPSLLK
jgi:DNA invertase Pin-like site-specific DNA recombinase